jgi:hypothetical protein
MFLPFSVLNGTGGNGAKAYQCCGCGGLVTHSDRLLPIGGKSRHIFQNPAGVECDFHTFSSCPGAVAPGEATEAYSWFPGYRWRLAFCRHCGLHLGWNYEATSTLKRPNLFWGILVSGILSR